MTAPIIKYFTYSHLPDFLQPISEACARLATKMDCDLPDNPEKSTGLRKLLEAKDCFIRAKLNLNGR